MGRVAVFLLSLAYLGCGDGRESETDSDGIAVSAGAVGAGGGGNTLRSQVDLLFESTCSGCHTHTFPFLPDLDGWIDLESAQSNLPIVTAGDHMASYLYHKLAGTHDTPVGSGLPMPLGAAPYTSEQLVVVAAWIDAL